MSKKLVSKEKIQVEMNLLKSKGSSNRLHLQELLAKKSRLEKSIQDLQQKINQQENRYKELQVLLTKIS